MMNRRDALKSLAALAGATGITMTPVTAHEASDVTVVFLQTNKRLSKAQCEQIRITWTQACEGTGLAGVKAIILNDGLTVELVRGRSR